MKTQDDNLFYEFGPFRMESRERRLIRDGELVPLPPKAFDILLVLIRNGGRLVEREELIKTVWGNAFVEENNLSVNISLIRKALTNHDDGSTEYIETIPKHGYRFVASVRSIPSDNAKFVTGKLVNKRMNAENERRANSQNVEDAFEKDTTRSGSSKQVPKGKLKELLISGAILVLCLIIVLVFWWHPANKSIVSPDETEVRRVVEASQMLETLTFYSKPKFFSMHQLSNWKKVL